jgi:enoyl-CoA hydratase/carnithine racemase
VAGWSPSSLAIVADEVGDVAVLRLNRPEVLNALTIEMLMDLSAGLRWYGSDDRARGVVLTGQGRAFSSGDDLKITEELQRDTFETLIEAFQDVTRAIFETEAPVVSALNGIAVGGAAEIACASDLRVGGPHSDFMFPENGLGLTISNGSTATLPALIGPRAMGLVLLGERIDAVRARELGLIDVWVDDPATVADEACRIAASFGEATPLHLRMLRLPAEQIERALSLEREAAMEAWEQGLPQRGIRRFLERRARS